MQPSQEWIRDRLGYYPEEFLLNLPTSCQGCAYAFLGRPDENREMGFVKPLTDNAAETTDIDLELVSPLVSAELMENLKYKSRTLSISFYSYRVEIDLEISYQSRLFCFPQKSEELLRQLNLFWAASEEDWSAWEEYVGIPAWYCTCESIWARMADWIDEKQFDILMQGLKDGICKWYQNQWDFSG
jgi:hypothetical protein